MNIFDTCCKGEVDALNKFLKNNPSIDVKQKNARGHTPLQVCVLSYNPKVDMLKALLLHRAKQNARFTLAEHNNANPDNTPPPSSLEIYLCNNESITFNELAQILKTTPKTVMTTLFANGETPLTQLCKLAYLPNNAQKQRIDINQVNELMQLCIDYGALPNQVNAKRETPIFIIGKYLLDLADNDIDSAVKRKNCKHRSIKNSFSC